MSVGEVWEIPLRKTLKVLSEQLLLGVVALQMPIQKNHYMHEMGPFPSMVTYCEITSDCYIAHTVRIHALCNSYNMIPM